MGKELFRKELAKFRPYIPGKPLEEVKREYGLTEIEKLASNENQLGPSQMAMDAIIKAVHDINLYPESSAIDLRKDIAEHLGVKLENIVVGNGGEELLSVTAQTFINEGDEIITADPSFGIYITTTSLLGAKVVSIPLKNKNYDFDSIIEAVTDKTKIIFICNPNNPTGSIVTKHELDHFFENIPDDVVILLDEAYYEFAAVNEDYPNGIEYLSKRPNTIVLRTFSKVYGIAGLRVGYIITSENIAAEMNKVKLTFDVNRLAQEAARGALKDKEHVNKTVEMNYKSLGLMEAFFEEAGIDYFKSYANFIFADVNMNSGTVFEEMIKRGVIIRPGHLWGWDNWIRVSTGNIDQTQKFINNLREVLNENRNHSADC